MSGYQHFGVYSVCPIPFLPCAFGRDAEDQNPADWAPGLGPTQGNASLTDLPGRGQLWAKRKGSRVLGHLQVEPQKVEVHPLPEDRHPQCPGLGGLYSGWRALSGGSQPQRR